MAHPVLYRIKVSLHSLDFPVSLRKPNPEIIHRLAQVFKGTLDRFSHPIPADSEDVCELPDYHGIYHGQIKCLHGQHRVAAARLVLKNPEDQWWYVDVYQLTAPQRSESDY